MLLDLTPHPAAMYRVIEEELPSLHDFVSPQLLRDHYEGMTAEQVRALSRSPLFQIGAHTLDHPYLTKCSPEESLRQLRENKEWIERTTGRRCVSIAYPLGDFDERTVSQCRELGFTAGFAVEPLLRSSPEFSLERLGIYFASLPKLAVKARWGSWIRKLGLGIG
jgi:peptidoglycan/xylan/chitin deacetylase (PgdA/CDA1 family)